MWQFLLGFIMAWCICHAYTHIMIASECEKLGGFFVNDKIYKCVLIKGKEDDMEK